MILDDTSIIEPFSAVFKFFKQAFTRDIDATKDGNENLCMICSDRCVGIKFEPCGHPSCKRCYEIHKSNGNSKCYFCLTPIDSISEIGTKNLKIDGELQTS
jgi:hypothetical protein